MGSAATMHVTALPLGLLLQISFFVDSMSQSFVCWALSSRSRIMGELSAAVSSSRVKLKPGCGHAWSSDDTRSSAGHSAGQIQMQIIRAQWLLTSVRPEERLSLMAC